MKRIKALIVAAAVCLGAVVATTAVAHAAQNSPEVSESITEIAKPVLDAVLAGDWFAAAALMLVLLVALFSRYAPWKWAQFAEVKAALVLVGAFGGALATSALAGAPVTGATLWVALKVALSAAGGYSLFKALALPLLGRLNGKLPAFIQPIIGLLLAFFAKSDPAAKAKKAGDLAVGSNPPSGASGVIGEPKDVD